MASGGTSLTFRELSTGRYRDPLSGRFVKNPLIEKELAVGLAMKETLAAEAEKVTEAAKSLARVEAYDTGDYYRGLRPASGLTDDPLVGKTMVGRVNAWDWKSGWIEFGSIHTNPPTGKHILQRAAEAVGYAVSVSQNFRRIVGTGRERVTKLAGH